MKKRTPTIFKSKNFTAFYVLGSKKPNQDRRYVILRLNGRGIFSDLRLEATIKNGLKPLKVLPSEFRDQGIKGGFPMNELIKLNTKFMEFGQRAIQIGDYMKDTKLDIQAIYKEAFNVKQDVTSLSKSFCFTELLQTPNKLFHTITEGSNDEETTVVEFNDYAADNTGTKIPRKVKFKKQDVEEFEVRVKSGYYPTYEHNGKTYLDVEDSDDVEFFINDVAVDRGKQKENQFISGLSVEERYQNKEYWNQNNIFELLGYIRFGRRTNALKKDVPIAKIFFHRLFKKLLYYRANVKPPEHVDNFNVEWVHGFYRFLYYNGFERRLQKASHNPFIVAAEYVMKENPNVEKYSISTFKEGIHKQMMFYIKKLYELELIPKDFSKQIDLKAFTSTDQTNESTYDGNSVYNITVKEFITLVKSDLKDIDLIQTRDVFVFQILAGALRPSDLRKDKIFHQLDGLELVKFNMGKTGGLIDNTLIKPVKDILKKYDSLPVPKDNTTYNNNLRTLFKKLYLDREIVIVNKKLDQEIVKRYKLYEKVSGKFARSTHYLIYGALGEPFEKIAKRAGHASLDIAMKHYYVVGTNYTKEHIDEILKYFETGK